jgi:phage tail sheath protein FI
MDGTGNQLPTASGISGTKSPGLYLEQNFALPRNVYFATGVPAFLGTMDKASTSAAKPRMLSLWSHFAPYIGEPYPGCHLAAAVQGFFENGGHWCYVVVLRDRSDQSLEEGLQVIADLDSIDLVCVPDLQGDRAAVLAQQQTVVDHCQEMGDRFAILDSQPGDTPEGACDQWSQIDGMNGAIYYPWIRVSGSTGAVESVPPCGHIAGVFSRVDRNTGVHKAPANEVLTGVLDLERKTTEQVSATLNSRGVNCLRSFAGRGILVWGARTLSGQPTWTYINVRRLFLTAARWIDWSLRDLTFETNDARLWNRIERRLTEYFAAQYRVGALKGDSLKEAFYVRCNSDTNPAEMRDSGRVVTEIGLAPAVPFEFVVVRLIRGTRGVQILSS